MKTSPSSPQKTKPHLLYRSIRLTILILLALFIIIAGALSTTLRFSFQIAEKVIPSIIKDAYSKALPTILERSEGLNLEASPIETWSGPRPASATIPFPFSPDRPTLIVLIHGATRPPSEDSNIGTLAGARNYWGFHFVSGLLQAESLQTLSGTTLTSETWTNTALDDTLPGDHIVVATHEAGIVTNAGYVALLYHDGSDFLGPQAEATVTQLGKLVDYFETQLGIEPQLVLLSHSMGGLVARFVLNAPEAHTPPFLLSATTREKAIKIRDRTLYLITLSTPHEGSRAANDVLIMEQVTLLTQTVLDRLGLSRDRDPQHAAMAFLRAFQPSTQHLRTDTLAALNNSTNGLLAPQHGRRSDGSLIPIYALSGRSPGGGFFQYPTSTLALELALLELQGNRLNLGNKLRNDTLSMLLSDYLLHNFPGFTQGWGKIPDGLEQLDKVARVQAIGTFKLSIPSYADFARRSVSLETFPPFYLNREYELLRKDDPTPSDRLEMWLDSVITATLDRPDLSELGDSILENAPIEEIRCRFLGAEVCLFKGSGTSKDGEIDADGVVSIDSGLGLFLGTEIPYFFAHDQLWDLGYGLEYGSWYRLGVGDQGLEVSPYPWEWGNHAFMQYSGDVAIWLNQHILNTAGPIISPDTFSTWNPIK